MRTHRARQFKSLLERLWQRPVLSDEFVQNAVELLSRTMNTEVATLYAYDSRADELLLVATRGLVRSGVGFVTLEPGTNVTGLAAKERRPVFTADVRSDPIYISIPTFDQERYLSLLAVPILLEDELIGAVNIQTIAVHQYSQREIQELSECATVLGPYLRDLWRRDLAARLRGTSVLARLEGFLQHDQEPVEIAHQLSQQLAVAFPTRRCTVVLRNPDDTHSQFGDDLDRSIEELISVSQTGCAGDRQIHFDEDGNIWVPLVAGKTPMGLIHVAVDDASKEPISSAAARVIESLAALVSTALGRVHNSTKPVEVTQRERAYEELMQMVLDDAGIEVLLARASELCRGPVAVTDTMGIHVAGVMPPITAANLPLRAGDAMLGRLLASRPLEAVPAMPAVALAVALELARWTQRFEVERNLRGDALDSLLAGNLNASEISIRGSLLGIDVERPYVIVMFKVDIADLAEKRGSTWLRSLSTTIQRGFGGAPASASFVRSDGIVVFLAQAGLRQTTKHVVASVLEAVRLTAPGVAVSAGIGPGVNDPGQYAASIRHARLAADLAMQLAASGPVNATEIGAYFLLAGIDDSERLQEFVDEHLGVLVEHDQRRGTEFVRTLEAYHAAGERLRPAADLLFIHVNTLKHRLARIDTLTGRDLEQVSRRFNMYLGLYALKLLNPDRRSLLPVAFSSDANPAP